MKAIENTTPKETTDKLLEATDEIARLIAICTHVHDRLLRGDDDRTLLAELAGGWQGMNAQSDSGPRPAMDDALWERDAYFAEAARTKETLAEIIPALEVASGCKAGDLRSTWPGNDLTPDEWAGLWMARAILEDRKDQDHD